MRQCHNSTDNTEDDFEETWPAGGFGVHRDRGWHILFDIRVLDTDAPSRVSRSIASILWRSAEE